MAGSSADGLLTGFDVCRLLQCEGSSTLSKDFYADTGGHTMRDQFLSACASTNTTLTKVASYTATTCRWLSVHGNDWFVGSIRQDKGVAALPGQILCSGTPYAWS